MDLSEEKKQVTGRGNKPTSVGTNRIQLIEKEEKDNKKVVIKLTGLIWSDLSVTEIHEM